MAIATEFPFQQVYCENCEMATWGVPRLMDSGAVIFECWDCSHHTLVG